MKVRNVSLSTQLIYMIPLIPAREVYPSLIINISEDRASDLEGNVSRQADDLFFLSF